MLAHLKILTIYVAVLVRDLSYRKEVMKLLCHWQALLVQLALFLSRAEIIATALAISQKRLPIHLLPFFLKYDILFGDLGFSFR